MATTTHTTTTCDRCERALYGDGAEWGWLHIPQRGNPMLPPHAQPGDLDFCSWRCLAAYAAGRAEREAETAGAITFAPLDPDDPRGAWFRVTSRGDSQGPSD